MGNRAHRREMQAPVREGAYAHRVRDRVAGKLELELIVGLLNSIRREFGSVGCSARLPRMLISSYKKHRVPELQLRRVRNNPPKARKRSRAVSVGVNIGFLEEAVTRTRFFVVGH